MTLLISNYIIKGKIISFEDDTSLVFESDNWEEVFIIAQNRFEMTKGWLESNMLTMNVDKTKNICFSIGQVVSTSCDLPITSHQCLLKDS